MHSLQPNFFQFPNLVADRFMRFMTPTQFACLVVIIRKTRGWHREADAISLSQFQELTGIKSKKTIIRACDVLEGAGLVSTVKKHRTTTVYRLGSAFDGKKYTQDLGVKIEQALLEQNTPKTHYLGVKNTHTKDISLNKKEREKRAGCAQVKSDGVTAVGQQGDERHNRPESIDHYLAALNPAIRRAMGGGDEM